MSEWEKSNQAGDENKTARPLIPFVDSKGRGALTNPKNRFEKQERLAYYEDIFDPEPHRPRTQF